MMRTQKALRVIAMIVPKPIPAIQASNIESQRKICTNTKRVNGFLCGMRCAG